MRELNNMELDTVGGGGIFGSFGGLLGGAIGQIVDAGYSAITGKTIPASAVSSAQQLGTGIGLITDSVLNPTNIPTVVQDMTQGIIGIISAARTDISALKS